MCSCYKLLSKILANLRFDLKNVLMWFTVDSFKPNPGKFQYMILRKCVTNQLSFFINPHMHKMGPQGPKHYIFGDHFTQKMPESSGSMYSSILMLENIWYYHFTWSGPNSQEIVNLFQFSSGPPGTHNSNEIHNFLWIRSTSGKMMMSYVF